MADATVRVRAHGFWLVVDNRIVNRLGLLVRVNDGPWQWRERDAK